MTRVFRLGLTLTLSALMFSACATSIRDVRTDPSKYRDRDVTVSGRVSESLSLLDRGVYHLTDGSSDIWVVSEHGVPGKGAKVKVTGTTRKGFNLGSFGDRLGLPEGLANAVVLVESSHSIR